MCRNLVAICLVLVMASVSSAYVIVGNWETGNYGWVDGKTAGWNGTNVVGLAPGQSTGVTLGTGAPLRLIQRPGGTGTHPSQHGTAA